MPEYDDLISTQFALTITRVPVGLFSEISGLTAEVETLTYNEGGMNGFAHRLPTRVKYQNLVLKRGITDDKRLLDWFQKSHLEAERSDITIDMLGADGKRILGWGITNAYPVKWTGPTFNAGQSQVVTEALEIAHEGIRVV